MTTSTPLPVGVDPHHLTDDFAVQILSDEGAQCGDCGDQPGDRICPDCEKCRHRYVLALRAAGWGPATALIAEVQRLDGESTELKSRRGIELTYRAELGMALRHLAAELTAARTSITVAVAALEHGQRMETAPITKARLQLIADELRNAAGTGAVR